MTTTINIYTCGLQLLECSGRPPTPETETVVAVMQQSWSHVRNMLKPGGNAPFRMTELNGPSKHPAFREEPPDSGCKHALLAFVGSPVGSIVTRGLRSLPT